MDGSGPNAPPHDLIVMEKMELDKYKKDKKHKLAPEVCAHARASVRPGL